VFLGLVFVVHFVAKRYILVPTAKVSEETNRNIPARNMLVQLLAVYTHPRATMHSVTDRQTDGQTDNRMMPIADHTV